MEHFSNLHLLRPEQVRFGAEFLKSLINQFAAWQEQRGGEARVPMIVVDLRNERNGCYELADRANQHEYQRRLPHCTVICRTITVLFEGICSRFT